MNWVSFGATLLFGASTFWLGWTYGKRHLALAIKKMMVKAGTWPDEATHRQEP